MTRRKFSKLFALAASLLLLPGLQCNQEASDLLTSLRGIVKSVETALGALGLLQGLLPDVVNQAAQYLLKVLKFVEDAANLLQDETQSATDKARQILSWAAGLVVPKIPDPKVQTIIAAVAAAVDKFLSYFGTDQAGAGVVARSQAPPKVPNLSFSEKEKQQLKAIPPDAMRDERAVEEWQKRATATPHSKLEYHTPQFQVLG